MKLLLLLLSTVTLIATAGCDWDEDHHHRGGAYGGYHGEYPIGAMAMGNIALIITTTIGIAIGTELLPTEQQGQGREQRVAKGFSRCSWRAYESGSVGCAARRIKWLKLRRKQCSGLFVLALAVLLQLPGQPVWGKRFGQEIEKLASSLSLVLSLGAGAGTAGINHLEAGFFAAQAIRQSGTAFSAGSVKSVSKRSATEAPLSHSNQGGRRAIGFDDLISTTT